MSSVNTNMSSASTRSERSRSRSRSGARTQEWEGALREIKGDRSLLRTSNFKDDPRFVLLAVQRDGSALRYAAPPLRTDREIIKAAVQSDVKILRWDDENREYDPDTGAWFDYPSSQFQHYGCQNEIVRAAVQAPVDMSYLWPWENQALPFVHPEFRADIEIVQLAVQANGMQLGSAHGSLKENPEVVLLAVQQNGLALQFAHSSLQADRSIVLAAVQENGGALQYVDASLKCDREIVLAAVQNENCYLSMNPCGLLYPVHPLTLCDPRFLGDKEIVLAAMQTEYKDPPTKYRNTPVFGLDSINETLRADPEVVLAAMRKNRNNFEYASADLRSQRDIVCEAVVRDVCCFRHCSDPALCTEMLGAAGIQPPFASVRPGTDEADRLRDVARAHLRPVVIQVGRPEQVADNRYRFELRTLGGTIVFVEVTPNLTNTTTTEALRRPAAAVFPLSGPVDFEDRHNTAAAGRRFNFVLTSGAVGKVGCEVALGIN